MVEGRYSRASVSDQWYFVECKQSYFDQNNVEVLGNITMVTSFIYNIHTLAILFSTFFVSVNP